MPTMSQQMHDTACHAWVETGAPSAGILHRGSTKPPAEPDRATAACPPSRPAARPARRSRLARLFRSRFSDAACLLAGLCLLTAVPGAWAQAVTLVENNDAGTDDSLNNYKTAINYFAQSFVAAEAFTLASVRIYYGAIGMNAAFAVTVHTPHADDANKPGDEVAQLTRDGPLSGISNVYEAPSNTNLQAGTYFVQVQRTQGSTELLDQGTAAETSGSRMGWSIADEARYSENGSSWTSDDVPFRMAVNGTLPNTAPTVTNAIPDQAATVGTAFSYTFPENTFSDSDNDPLTYTATKADDTDLPGWLTFNAATRTFSGTPQAGDVGTLSVKVAASDGQAGYDPAVDIFDIAVTVPGDVPRNLSTIQDARFRLVWLPPSNPGSKTLTGYQYRYSAGSSVTGDPAWTDVPGAGRQRAVEVTGLLNSTLYTFEVRAVYGTETSEAATTTVRTAVPTPRLTATYAEGDAGNTTIELSWTAIDSLGDEAVTGYHVQESPDGTPVWTTRVADTGNTDTTYRRGGLTRGDIRQYRVRALSASRTSNFSKGFQVRTRPAVPPEPDAVLTPDGVSFRYILSWEPVEAQGDPVYEFRIGADGGVWSERPRIRSDGQRYIKVSGRPDALVQTQVRAVLCGRRLPGQSRARPGPCGRERFDIIRGPWSDAGQVADGTPDAPEAFDPFGTLMVGPRSHDGRQPFTLELRFNKDPEPLSYRTVRDTLLEVSGGTVTDARRVTRGSDRQWGITVQPAGAGDVHVLLPVRSQPCTDEATVCAGSERLVEAVSHVVRGPGTVPSASFAALPAHHDGTTPFTVELHFSEEPQGLSYTTVGGGLLEVSGATVTGARRLQPPGNRGWAVNVTPTHADAIVLTLPARACTEANAVCFDGQPLTRAATATVRGAPLTATLVEVPENHDGSAFTFELAFSEDVGGLSYKTVRDSAFAVTGGRVTNARRLAPPGNQRWEVHVQPSGYADMTLALDATQDCSATGAICTPQGKKQSTSTSVTVRGPVTLSVADAEVEENAPGASLAFVVTLSRARDEVTTVGYATADGSATAGDDYTATSGTLTFGAGETSRTVQVPVLDDAHDEGNETLTFALSNPSPSSVKLADASATGTIENTDMMPQAWLARFGRTVAEQVLGAVESRMRAGRAPGVEVSLAGRRIGWRPDAGGARAGLRDATGDGGSGPDDGTDSGRILSPDSDSDSDPALARGLRSPGGFGPARDSDAAAGLADWLRGERDGGHAWSRLVTGRELLFGSSFALAGEAGGAGGGTVAVWGRGTVSRFDGRDGDLSVDGEVASGMIGADWSRGRAMAGLIAGHSRGEGGYRGPSGAGGVVSSTLTGLYPWGRYALSERMELWGAAGYGEGTLTLTPESQDAMRTDLDLSMAAAGLRGVLIDGGGDGITLAAKTDAMTVTTSSDAAPGLAASEGGVTRLRLGLEGALPLRLAEGSVLTPSLEIGVRRDGGDAETGFGADIGGGIAWRDTRRGLAAELRGRGLLTHESDGFRDRGLSGSLHWEPAEGGRGPRVTLTQTVGGASSGGADALLGRGTLAGLDANEDGAGGGDLESRRLEARFGYGFGVFGDRFTATPELGVGLSDTGREYRLGWGLGLVRKGSVSMGFELSGTRREAAVDDGAGPEHALMLRGQIRW